MRQFWLVIAVICAPMAALAEGYVLQSGDRVDVRVAGLPNLDRELRIGDDGTISLPLIGRVSLRDKTVAEAEQDVAQRFGTVAFRQRSLDGRETLFSISPSEVSLSVTEFRPIYVAGDVKMPGAFDFSPGLTVRRAVTLSGGVGQDVGMYRDPFAQVAQIQGNIDAFTAELAALEVRINRYQTELEPADPGFGAAAGPGAAPGAETVEQVERQRLDAGTAGQQTRRAYLTEARAAITNQIEILREQLEAELEGVEADQQEYNRISTLRERGLVEVDRVTETRRSLLSSATRRLDTASDLAAAEKELARFNFELGDLDDEARRDALEELSEALVDRETTRARLIAARQQLLFLDMTSADQQQQSVVTVTLRRGAGAAEESFTLAGEEDMALRPGDLVEVRLSVVPLPGQ